VNLSSVLLPAFLCFFSAAAVSAQDFPGNAPSEGRLPMEASSLEKKVQMLLDYMEIQNVMARHVYYYNAQKQYEELDDIWSKAPDIAYGHNGGFKVGQESVRNYYGKTNDRQRKKKLEIMSRLYPDVENVKENEGIGDLVMMPVQTPCIEVAGDGRTAKGVWFSHGMNFEVGADGKPVAYSFWGKIGVDFIKEDGKWKIWHLAGYGDVMWRRDQEWVENINPPLERTVDGGEFWDMAKDPPYRLYNAKTLPQYDPKPPAPYETWDESLSYVK
jgi:hypothetical protein